MPKNVTVFRRTILIAIMFVILFSGHTHLGLAEAPVTILSLTVRKEQLQRNFPTRVLFLKKPALP